MYTHLDINQTWGPDLLIDCPACGAAGVPGLSYELKERLNFVYVHKTVWVVCSACGRRLLSRLPLDDLAGEPPHQISYHLEVRNSLPGRLMAICAMILSPTPALGLVVAVIAVLMNRKSSGWPKKVGYTGLAISLIFNLLFFAVFLLVE
jgi:hypothetical protein